MPHPSRLVRAIAILLAGVFLAVNFVNALYKGGDFDAYYAAGQRVLTGAALYGGSAIAFGFVGPPVQALLFAPFALLDPAPARLAFYGFNVLLLWYALATWLGLLVPPAGSAPPAADQPAWRRGTALFLSRPAVLSILAVAFPLQTQFEHQNLNIVLLALAGYAADAFMRQRPVACGAALGLASAIKVYPVTALIWLGLRREWRVFGAGLAAAAAFATAPLIVRGPRDFAADLAEWTSLQAEGWPTRRANQSLAAMWGRYVLGEGPDGFPNLTIQAPMAIGLAVATALVVAAPLVVALVRVRPGRLQVVEELICVGALGILISPIAWEHYWVGFFPLFLVLAVYGWERPPPWRSSWPSRWARLSLWVGVICVTVLSRAIAGWHGARVVRAWSLMTWAGVWSVAVLATILAANREPGVGIDRDDVARHTS
jgi:hypothetical protein